MTDRHKHEFGHRIDWLLPESLLSGAESRYRARVLTLFVLVLISIGAIAITVLATIEQSMPFRRMITFVLMCSTALSLVVMRKTQSVTPAARLFIGLTMLLTFYIDFNNLSVQGPNTFLWLIPCAVAAMLLRGRDAAVVTVISMLAILFNYMCLKLEWLPNPITDPATWGTVRVVIIFVVICITASCVYGLSTLANVHAENLFQEVERHKETITELEQAKDLAVASAKSKAMFLATMSHELRTPLNGVLGSADLLSRESLSGVMRDRVEDISAAGSLLLSIINDILDFSKLENQQVELHPAPYALSEQLHTLRRMMLPRLKDGVVFNLKGIDQPVLINADENRMAQILLNLMSNAAKFTEVGAITVEVSFDEQSHLILSVEDTGIGIALSDQQKLFADFSQVGDRYHSEGSGLGLAISKRLIESMGGEILVKSNVGQGTRFTIHLPFSIVSNEVIASTDISEEDDQYKDLLRNKQVLIVDDIKMNCVVLQSMLEEMGVEGVTLAYDGLQAVKIVDANPNFDLIFMDVRMPNMDGLEAAKRIRELAFQQPIIAVTANAFAEDQNACIRAGMTDFISKPVVFDAIVMTILKVLPS